MAGEPTVNAGTAPSAAAAAPIETHCPYRQATLLQQALEPDKMRVGLFLGAGCPVAVRIPDGADTKPLIPDVAGLTTQVRTLLESSAKHKMTLVAVVKHLTDGSGAQPNIEAILSHVRGLCDVIRGSTLDGLSKTALAELETEIYEHTNKIVEVRLPSNETPYHRVTAWIRGIKRAHPVEIFTSNYDLLMEQALEESRVPYFDGFVGSDRTFFDIGSIEQDVLPPRWARLWKVHGSVNWWQTTAGRVERRAKRVDDNDRRVIYPTHLKYDESRRMPYLAMLDRLRAFLSQGQVVLVTCGYSFVDQHINDAILQGLSSNPNAICFGLLFGDRAKSAKAVEQARVNPNLSLLAADGAVLGTIERDWHPSEKTEHALNGLAVKTGAIAGRTDAPDDRCKLLLGDFKAFGEFLAQELSHRLDAESNVNAP